MDATGFRKLLDTSLALLPEKMDTIMARAELAAIGLQESQLIHRRQMGNGPARGLWQFEKNGGVRGVMTFGTTEALARSLCTQRGFVPAVQSAYDMLEHDDVLACCFARLLLYTDPRPLPPVGAVDAAWRYYIDNWRPGKPHPQVWPKNYSNALDLLAAGV
jgi:hypothetical protein